MTSTLIINDIDDLVVDRLRTLAVAKNRTAEQQARAMLEELLPSPRTFDRAAYAAAISAMTPVDVQQTDSLILLREDRARDDEGE